MSVYIGTEGLEPTTSRAYSSALPTELRSYVSTGYFYLADKI